jgi:diguanylate cyclase (GGDEF)-like protein
MWKLPSDITDTREDELLVQYVLDQLKNPEAFYNKLNELYASARDDWDTIMLKDGRIFELLSCPIINEENVNGTFWSFRDVTEKKLAEEKLQRMATIDSLTGLFNRQSFETELTQTLAHIRRYGRDASLIMFDVDHFKVINDNFGHAAGDQVLVELAERSKAVLREADFLVRWGGEEFIVILPETDARAAGEAAERLRRYMETEPFFPVGRMTISLGVTGILPTDTKDSLLKRLDDALYESKRLGRNRLVVM